MWGVPSPVVVSRRFVAKVGVKCSVGCPLAGQPIVVRNEAGADVGHGRLDDQPEPGTTALYAAELTLPAPDEAGVYNWTATFAAEAPDSSEDPSHASAAATFGFRTVPPPEHRVTVTVRDGETEAPLGGADVRLGVYSGTTDANGTAEVAVRSGTYELYVRKPGYEPHTDSAKVSGDVTLRVGAARVSDADPDDEQVWM